MSYKVIFHKNAVKDAEKLKSAGLDKKAKDLIEIIAKNPFENPPSYEKLVGNLTGAYSRRINIQHRLVYSVDEENKIVKVKGELSQIPEKIEVDITNLDIEDSFKVNDIKIDNLTIMENKAQIIVMVASTRNVTAEAPGK